VVAPEGDRAALIGRRPGWGSIPRGEAILERPAHVVPP
jgi:hypothetical protein